MSEIKVFECGLCKRDKRIGRTRYGLRKHIKEIHKIMSNLTNSGYDPKTGYVKQRWWIVR